ncbi:MAG: hypothetical protein WAW42_06850 [Candidatus Competibacteraceae bacterium]
MVRFTRWGGGEHLIETCDCYTFEYGGDLEQAVAQPNALADGLS